MLELSLLLDCDCSTDEDEVVEVKPFCWFEQAANRTKLLMLKLYFSFLILNSFSLTLILLSQS